MTRHLDRSVGIVAFGLSGVAAYLFLLVGGRALGPQGFASLGALWAVVFLGMAALPAPIEMAVARDVAAARARGDSLRPSVLAGLALGSASGIVAVAAALLAGGWLDHTVFGGQAGFSIAGAIAFAGLAIGAAAKGACAGANRLVGWGGYSLLDGGTRLVVSVVAALIAPEPGWFAIALAIGPWVGLVAPAISLIRLLQNDGRSRELRDHVVALARATAPLAVSASAAASLTYFGAVLLPVLVPGPSAQVGTYIAALALARLPLFAFSPLVAIAVPPIAYALERVDLVAARKAASLLMASAIVGGLVVIVAALGLGRSSLISSFGPGFSLSDASMRAIGVAAACWLVATASAAIAIAAGRGLWAAIGWSTGLACAAVMAAIGASDPFGRTDAAIVLGAVVAAIATGLAAFGAMSRQALRLSATPSR